MKCRSASAADIKQEYRSTRARVRALWLEKVGNVSPLPANREPGRRSARPGSSAAVVNSAASTKKFPAPSGSANAADKTKMKCRSASAADIKQEYRSTRARVRALWLEKVGNASPHRR